MGLDKLFSLLALSAGLALFPNTADAQKPSRRADNKITATKPSPDALAVLVCVAHTAVYETPDCLSIADPTLSKNIDHPISPASLVKMMTAYMVYRHVRDHNKSLDDPFITLTEQDRVEGRMGLKNGILSDCKGYSPVELMAGLTLTYRDAILAMTAFSANNAAIASAKSLAPDGREASFAARMTEQARDLGLASTRFMNASGMPWDGQTTTARDMARLLNIIVADLGREQFRQLFGNETARIAGLAIHRNGQEIGNSIKLLQRDELNILGAKTGTLTRLSNIAFYADPNSIGTITIILGSPNGAARDGLAVQLLQRAAKLVSSPAYAARPPVAY